MYYVYILQSEPDKEFYVGQTGDLKRRYSEHQAGRVESTKNRLPLNYCVMKRIIQKKKRPDGKNI